MVSTLGELMRRPKTSWEKIIRVHGGRKPMIKPGGIGHRRCPKTTDVRSLRLLANRPLS